MSDSAAQSNRQTKPRLQVSLTTVLPAVAAIATVLAHYKTQKDRIHLWYELHHMRAMSDHLTVADPSKIVARRVMAHWNDDYRWKVFLPTGSECQLSVETGQLESPDSSRKFSLSSGEHLLHLRVIHRDFTQGAELRIDGKRVWEEPGDESWKGNGYAIDEIHGLEQFEQNERAQLIEMRDRKGVGVRLSVAQISR